MLSRRVRPPPHAPAAHSLRRQVVQVLYNRQVIQFVVAGSRRARPPPHAPADGPLRHTSPLVVQAGYTSPLSHKLICYAGRRARLSSEGLGPAGPDPAHPPTASAVSGARAARKRRGARRAAGRRPRRAGGWKPRPLFSKGGRPEPGQRPAGNHAGA